MTRLGTLLSSAELPPDYVSDTFTITATGFSGTVNGTASYVKVGALVSLWLPTLSGTSNAGTMTLTGIPAAIQSSQYGNGPAVKLADNGLDLGVPGYLRLVR